MRSAVATSVTARVAGGVLVAALSTLVLAGAGSRQDDGQVPTFRSTVDLIAVDVQVLDDDGTPIPDLVPEDFEVSISGERRRVISADYIRTTTVDGEPLVRDDNTRSVATNLWPIEPGTPDGRIYVLAFDVGSLSLSDSRAVESSARAFVERLLPNDLVGFYSFPVGRMIDPTTDRAVLRQALGSLMGGVSQGVANRFNLSMSEIIDINSELAGSGGNVLGSVIARECPEYGSGCVGQIQLEAQSLGFYLEGRAIESLNGMRNLVDALGQYPGRKTVVLFSSGMPTADRPGGRPDVGNLPIELGQHAATTNTSIYTLYIDSSELRAMSAENRRMVGTPGTRSRDHMVGSRIMEEFTGASGGAFTRILTGSGEYSLDRVLRETSSHYLLGVEPDPDDRDGRLRSLRIRVNRRDVTIRGRSWVIVPEAQP